SRSRASRRLRLPRDSAPRSTAAAPAPATRSSRARAPPTRRSAGRRTAGSFRHVSSLRLPGRNRSVRGATLQRRGDLGRVAGDVDAVDVARARNPDLELLLDATGVRREQHDAIAETDGLADVVRHEHDRLLARLPDLLEVAVELLARERIELGERLVHEQ